MERALRLFADGDIVMNDIEVNSKRKAVRPPTKHNKATGKESGTVLAFSEANWGHVMKSYMTSINNLGDGVIEAVSKHAHIIAAKRRNAPTNLRLALDEESEDERACIC